MKKLIVLLCFFISYFINSQIKPQKHYLYLSDYKLAPTFTKKNGVLIYSGRNVAESDFFKNKNVTYFEQAFPDAIDPEVLNIFYLETTSTDLVDLLKLRSPSLYKKADNITNLKFETLSTPDYYPNDYGSSSPVANLGFNYNRKEWDYLNVPKAWGITTGSANIKIGISDNPIKSDDPDFLGKVVPVDGYNLYNYFSHGTDVAAIAAARGNNAYGSAGVCMDCNIVEGPLDINIAPGPNLTYSNLYKMAKKGAKVINMSWHNSGYLNMNIDSPDYYNPVSRFGAPFPILAQQLVINDLVNNFRVTLVAASGNSPSFGTPTSNNSANESPLPYGIRYMYPASYDNVISVGSIEFQNKIVLPMTNSQSSYCCTSPLYPIHVGLEDSISTCNSALDPMNPVSVLKNGWYYTPQNVDGFLYMYTLNEKVDILAPGHEVYSHINTINNGSKTASGTSFSAPAVSGTIGLMLSLNDCLLPSEIEDVLQLTTKDVENMPLNQVFLPINHQNYPNLPGYVGAGKLEIGNAVEFTNEMKKTNGNALIRNHTFNRFDFALNKINNNLVIENVTLKDACKANFTAKNQITLLPGTNLKPNLAGRVYLSTNQNIDISCAPIIFPTNRNANNSNISNDLTSKTVLYPNPNNGSFQLYNIQSEKFGNQEIELNVFDLNGRSLHTQKFIKEELENYQINLLNLQSGIYIVRLSNSAYFEDLKFIKD